MVTAENLEKLQALVKEAEDVVRGFVAMQDKAPALEEMPEYKSRINYLSLAIDDVAAFVEDLAEAAP